MARYELNNEHNGVEIYFDGRPSEEARYLAKVIEMNLL